MNRNVGLFTVLGSLLLLGACATTRGYTVLTVPTPPAIVTQSSAKVVVIDVVRDEREFQADPRDPSIPSLKHGQNYKLNAIQREAAIGRKRDTWGKAMGDWILQDGQTVVSLTHDLVATTLRGLGYKVEDQAPAASDSEHVSIVINQFWAWFTPGFWTATIEAKLKTRLQFSGPEGSKSVVVNGYGRNQVQTGREANWQLAYDRAFRDYERNLREALRDSGQ